MLDYTITKYFVYIFCFVSKNFKKITISGVCILLFVFFTGEGRAALPGRMCGSPFSLYGRQTGGGGACSSRAMETPSGTSSAFPSASRAVSLYPVKLRYFAAAGAAAAATAADTVFRLVVDLVFVVPMHASSSR